MPKKTPQTIRRGRPRGWRRSRRRRHVRLVAAELARQVLAREQARA
jgi:hypothetical protein